jgi:hypothetical protein
MRLRRTTAHEKGDNGIEAGITEIQFILIFATLLRDYC